ncbi:hypothetical protein D3C78_847070 [compost metagenome]
MGLQAHDLDLAVGLDGLRGGGVFRARQLPLAGHEQRGQAGGCDGQGAVRQFHPVVEIHRLIRPRIVQRMDGGLYMAGRRAGIAALVRQLGLAHQGHGIATGRIVFVGGALLGPAQVHAGFGNFPGLVLVGHPFPAMPVAAGVDVLGQAGNGLCRGQQQGNGRRPVKLQAALNVAERKAGLCVLGVAVTGLQRGLAVGLQKGVGRLGPLQKQPEIVHALEIDDIDGGECLLLHQLDDGRQAVFAADGGVPVSMVLMEQLVGLVKKSVKGIALKGGRAAW